MWSSGYRTSKNAVESFRNTFEESVLTRFSRSFPNLTQNAVDVERVGHLFEFYVLPLIQNDHVKKKKTFVLISKYLVALTSDLEPEGDEKWASRFDNETIPPDLWEVFEREESSRFNWAEIFNKTAQFRKSTFSPKMTKSIQNQFSIFVSVLRSKLTSEKRIFLKIALDAIEYLENHEIDPGNLFVGTPPSDFVSKSLVPIISISNLNEQTTTNPSSSFPSSSPFSSTASLSSTQPKTEMNLQKQIMRWKALKNHPEQIEEEINQTVQHLLETQPKAMVGLVAVQISSIPRPYQSWFTNPQWSKFALWEFVYCRLAEPVVSSTVTSVFVYLDPWETFCVEVPVDSVFHFEGNASVIPFYEETNVTNVMWFSNPTFVFQWYFRRCIGDKVANYFDEKFKPTLISSAKFGELEEIININRIYLDLELHLAENSASRKLLNAEVCELLTQKNQEWIRSIPCGLFFPPKLELALEEISNSLEQVPTTIKKEISIILKHTKTLLLKYVKILQSVLNGQRKKEMCNWWLSHIEKRANKYLEDCGYRRDVIPENYTEEKPKDLDSLKKNLSIVQDLIEGESEELDNFVDETTLEVHKILEKLLDEIEFVLELRWTKMNLEVEYTEEDIESLKKDRDYLMKVKQMDLELKEKRKQKKREKEPLQMTDAVPVSGLVMARFHIFRAECQTSLMIWEKKMSPASALPTSRSNWPNDVLENSNQRDNFFGYCWSDNPATLTKAVSITHFGDWVWGEEEIDFEKGEEAPPKLSNSVGVTRGSAGDLGSLSARIQRKGSGVWKKIEPRNFQVDGSRGSHLYSPSRRATDTFAPNRTRKIQSFEDRRKFTRASPPLSPPPPLPKSRKPRSPRSLIKWGGPTNLPSLETSPPGDSPFNSPLKDHHNIQSARSPRSFSRWGGHTSLLSLDTSPPDDSLSSSLSLKSQDRQTKRRPSSSSSRETSASDSPFNSPVKSRRNHQSTRSMRPLTRWDGHSSLPSLEISPPSDSPPLVRRSPKKRRKKAGQKRAHSHQQIETLRVGGEKRNDDPFIE